MNTQAGDIEFEGIEVREVTLSPDERDRRDEYARLQKRYLSSR